MTVIPSTAGKPPIVKDWIVANVLSTVNVAVRVVVFPSRSRTDVLTTCDPTARFQVGVPVMVPDVALSFFVRETLSPSTVIVPDP